MVAWSVASFVIRGIFVLRRAGDVATVAQQLGFTFTPWTNDPKAIPRADTELFKTGWAGGIHNLMTGNYAGMDAEVMEFSRTTGPAGNSSTTVQTVAVYTQNVDLPQFVLQPGNLAIRILDALQHQKVDLDYPPGVSRHYAVHGPDKDRTRALFNESLVSFVESLDRSRGWHIEGAGKKLVVYRYRGRVKPIQLRDFLQETSSIAQSFFAQRQKPLASSAARG
jgi:hypothetical protein